MKIKKGEIAKEFMLGMVAGIGSIAVTYLVNKYILKKMGPDGTVN